MAAAFPYLFTPDATCPRGRGRGLLIVGELASRWDRDDGGAGRTVWFEIDW